MVLQTLREYKLYDIFFKCEFQLESVTFLGYILSKEGVMVDSTKIEAIRDQPKPTSVIEIQSFVGLAEYYKWFVEGFSTIAAPLTQLTRQGVLVVWFDECEASFLRMKELLTTSSTPTIFTVAERSLLCIVMPPTQGQVVY